MPDNVKDSKPSIWHHQKGMRTRAPLRIVSTLVTQMMKTMLPSMQIPITFHPTTPTPTAPPSMLPIFHIPALLCLSIFSLRGCTQRRRRKIIVDVEVVAVTVQLELFYSDFTSREGFSSASSFADDPRDTTSTTNSAGTNDMGQQILRGGW
ncbi:hypothetical protein DFH07DRAFT_773736 [Mycena maculata]|uniref:Uncharacterized protein n=1 Tax=Mycena maculata TaxID=230809 RepID=A0AAD7NCT1_9AGAR|nr:hypothetical protein DFH07DRAFT_773736 [Mycena maculata]